MPGGKGEEKIECFLGRKSPLRKLCFLARPELSLLINIFDLVNRGKSNQFVRACRDMSRDMINSI